MFGSCIAWMLELRGHVVVAATAAIPKVAGGPWSGVIVRQVDTTVVPWIAVCIEASGRLDGDQRGFRYIAGTILEE
jgi:hypothetical protein